MPQLGFSARLLEVILSEAVFSGGAKDLLSASFVPREIPVRLSFAMLGIRSGLAFGALAKTLAFGRHYPHAWSLL